MMTHATRSASGLKMLTGQLLAGLAGCPRVGTGS
jgi:hypothetical protein